MATGRDRINKRRPTRQRLQQAIPSPHGEHQVVVHVVYGGRGQLAAAAGVVDVNGASRPSSSPSKKLIYHGELIRQPAGRAPAGGKNGDVG